MLSSTIYLHALPNDTRPFACYGVTRDRMRFIFQTTVPPANTWIAVYTGRAGGRIKRMNIEIDEVSAGGNRQWSATARKPTRA